MHQDATFTEVPNDSDLGSNPPTPLDDKLSSTTTKTATTVADSEGGSWLSPKALDTFFDGLQTGFDLLSDTGEVSELQAQLTSDGSVAGGKLAPRELAVLQRKSGQLFINLYNLNLVDCVKAAPTESGGYDIYVPLDAKQAFEKRFKSPLGLSQGKVRCYLTISNPAKNEGSVAFFGTNSTTLLQMQQFIDEYAGDNPIGWAYRG